MSRIGSADAILIFVGLAAWVTILLFAMANFNEFRVCLEMQHPEVWKALGSPGFTRDKGNPWRIRRFLYSRRYREFNDPILTKLGNRALLGEVVLFVFWAAFIPWWIFGVGPLR